MKVLSITLKDIQLALKDSGAIVYLFLLPLIFIFLFAGGLNVLAGDGGEEGERRRGFPCRW